MSVSVIEPSLGERFFARAREWWWLWGVVGVLSGGASIGFTKFTAYYLAEASSILSMQTLTQNSELTLAHIKTIDDRLAQIDKSIMTMSFTEQRDGGSIGDLTDKVSLLEHDRMERNERRVKLANDLAEVNAKLTVLQSQQSWLGDFIRDNLMRAPKR